LSEKILDSKIQMPVRFRGLIERKELWEELREHPEKVVILNAGAGFGKTMLLTYYAEMTQDKCAWYHLGSLDNDLMTFIKYLSCSLGKILPDFNFSYEKFLQENKEDRRGHELVEQLANEFAIRLSQFSDSDISILLDDFQEINNEEIYHFLSVLINNTANNIRIFLATKGAFPQFLARYLLQGGAVMLGDRRLAFNRSEVIRILDNIGTLSDVAKCADFLLDYTEGWPAGVTAIALSLKNERRALDQEEITALCRESKVYDYVMYEIFKKLPYDIQTFLVHTSVLDILSVDLCNAVMKTASAKSTLDYLVQENVFVLMLRGKGNVYRYHSIFKDYLRNQISREAELDIFKKASVYCLNKGDYEQAVEYAISCDDGELMQTAFEQAGRQMMLQGENRILGRWIDFLMEAGVELSAKTNRILSGYYYSLEDGVRAYEFIECACSGFWAEENENEYVESMLKKIDYLEAQQELDLCLEEAKKAFTLVKRKYGINWYRLQSRKMELHLLLYQEKEAIAVAEEIRNGSMLYVRKDEKEAAAIRGDAEKVHKQGQCHLQEGEPEGEAVILASRVLTDYCNWCNIHALYLKGEESAAFSLAEPYLRDLEGENILRGFIRVVGCILLLHQNKDEEAGSLAAWTGNYFYQEHVRLPKLVREDLSLILDTYKLAINRREGSRVYMKCFHGGAIYIDKKEKAVRWRTKKTFELFAYLFENQGKAVQKDKVIDALWPEVPYDKACILFHTTLSYLRKTLTENELADLLQGRKGGYRIQTGHMDTDYNELMDIYRKVQDRNFQEIGRLEEFVELYHSPYFNSICSEWIVSSQEQLERIYVYCGREIAGELIQNQKYHESIPILNKILELDPYSEEILSLLMEACASLGDMKTVRKAYEGAARRFQEELGSELGSHVKELFWELVGSKEG